MAQPPTAPLRQEPLDPLVGVEFDDLRLVGVIGRGGVGVVYEAQQAGLNRRVAVKLLAPQFAANPEFLYRFQSEARLAARLRHPNVVEVYNIGNSRHGHYLVMELVRGCCVTDIVRRDGPLPWREATRIALEICRALAKAHRLDLVHRDVKPSNILRAHDGAVKLTDFGLSKNLQSPIDSLTVQGGVVGTPSYMSPEQARARPVDGRSDLYSLGATYYTMLVGQPPFAQFTDLVQLVFAHCAEPVPDPRERRPELPSAVNRLIQRAMAKEPSDRYPNADVMQMALEELLGLERAAGGETRSGSSSTRTFALFRSTESRSRINAALSPTSSSDIPVGAESSDASQATVGPDGSPRGSGVRLSDSSEEQRQHTATTSFSARPMPLPELPSPSGTIRPALDAVGPSPRSNVLPAMLAVVLLVLLAVGGYLLATDQLNLPREDSASDGAEPTEKPESKPYVDPTPDPKPAPKTQQEVPNPPRDGEPTPKHDPEPDPDPTPDEPPPMRPTAEKRPQKTLELAGGVSLVLTELPAGVFQMGSPKAQPRRADNEGARHSVRITRPFWIGVHEVTQAQFLAVMEVNPSAAMGADLPVENVTWSEAVEFCARLSTRTGLHIRLPTEAEWEYACRAGSREAFAWVDEPKGAMPGNFNGTRAYSRYWSFAEAGANRYLGKTRSAGGAANAWGMYDLHGNVAEWCHDGLRSYPAETGAELIKDPLGPTEADAARAVRGGSWASLPRSCRCAARAAEAPSSRRFDRGFRIVMFASTDDDPLTRR